ncbi:hypothetical protein [Vitreimonas flagellata]|uniref:hypothetical protein n=1 Tax=Vitreimonas flagellata TaxID=2560861 RepID=UPI001075140B|nr:hypothetical protein [Vitreimonas flagellata]
MSGWRDTGGRTARERRARDDQAARARFIETAKTRPLSLVKPALSALFVLVLIMALLLAFT